MASSELVGRLFLAVELEQHVREGLVAFISRALKGKPLPGRAPKPDNWHLTLHFLGDTNRTQYECLVAELKNEPLGAPFETVFGGLGAFPRTSKASVLWVGVVQGSDAFMRLANGVEKAIARAGMPPADKPFSPHLTLSRIRPPLSVDSIVQTAGAANLRMRVEHITLFRSHLGASGPRYEPLEKFALTSGLATN
jgi:2'-5' RNA ligase